MPETTVTYHDRAGVHNTAETLQAARKRAEALGIRQLVVATTTGRTAVTCAETMPEMDTIVAVMMHAVDREVFVERPGGRVRAPDADLVRLAREMGVKVYRGVHSLSGAVSSAVQGRFGGVSPETVIAQAYMTISTGTKVAVESVLMAADAGHLDMQADVVALGGWRGGADTAVVIKPAYTHSFFDLRIREFIALPRAAGE